MLYKISLCRYLATLPDETMWELTEASARGGGLVDFIRDHDAEYGYMFERVGDYNFIFMLTDEENYMLMLCACNPWRPEQLEPGRFPRWSRTI